MNKKKLEIELSKLETLNSKNIKLEQYQIEGSLAAEFLLFGLKDIQDKTVADFGCGNGILGYGCLLLNAEKVYFVDIDEEAIKLSKKNCSKFKNVEFFNCDVLGFNKKVDTVIMNPPFGVQNRKADKKFLEKAFEVSKNICSIHKLGSEKFIEKISQENNFEIVKFIKKKFMIKKSYKFHTKEKYFVDVGFWNLKSFK